MSALISKFAPSATRSAANLKRLVEHLLGEAVCRSFFVHVTHRFQ